MKRTIPLLITAIAGFILMISFFIPALRRAGEEAAIWFDVLASIAFILGGANLFRLQLQRISDRQPGWGYAGITLICFAATFLFGILKLGAPPEASVEAYGETAVPLPLSALPTYRVPLTAPARRGDAEPVPRSVRKQLSIVNGAGGSELVFTGWMSPGQQEDLVAYQDTLAWRCQIEQLGTLAQPPETLLKKVRYHPGHETLLFAGVMSDADRDALLKILQPSPQAQTAVEELDRLSQRITQKEVRNIPPGFMIPAEMNDRIQLERGQENQNGGPESRTVLSIAGPMSVSLRNQIATTWTNDPCVRPLLPEQEKELRAKIESFGQNLTDLQQTAFHNYFSADWKAESLVQALNSAGVTQPLKKTACELLAEIQSGVVEPERTHPAPPPVELNSAQVLLIQRFVETPEMTWDQLESQLPVAGELTEKQKKAFSQFKQELPTEADRQKGLCFRLLATGPLNSAQKRFLLQGARDQFAWRQAVGELFIAAHQQKFPWSGSYTAQGTPFWWLYEYVYQPLLTTTFALLAFYVASAAFRAFRAKNLEAILLLGTAFIILLGRTSAGPALTSWIPEQYSAFRSDQMTASIMSIFNTAGNRAIMIGIALGTVSTSLKVLLGIDRSYLGRGDD